MIKLWSFLRSYWYIPVILIIGIIIFLLTRKTDFMTKMLKIAKESYENQINTIEKLNKEEKEKKEDLQLKYEAVMRQVESKYQEDNKVLDEEKKKRIKELVENNTIEELNEKLKKEFFND